MKEEIAAVKDGSMSVKDMKGFAKYRRNRFEPQAVEALSHIVSIATDHELRSIAADAMGWYEYSSVKAEVLAECQKLYEAEQNEEIKNILLKSINRLK